jgi:hypothetical protein
MQKPLRLPDAYRFPGFRPEPIVRGFFGDPKARIVSLRRRQKKRPVAPVANPFEAVTTESRGKRAICPAATPASTWSSRFDGFTAIGATP